MAHRHSLGRRNSRSGTEKEEDETENNGYVHDYVKILEQGSYSVIVSWANGLATQLSKEQLLVVYGIGSLLLGLVAYEIWTCDLAQLFQRFCALLVPIFCISCAFYWLTVYLRRAWNSTSIYLFFCSCFVGEFLSQLLCSANSTEQYITQPCFLCIVLVSVCVSSLFSTLDTSQSALVIVSVSFLRFLACSNLQDFPQLLRPYTAYSAGLIGVLAAKYIETIYRTPINTFVTHDGKIPVIKRRRSSSSSAQGFRVGRRTSLPALSHKNQSSVPSYESELIREAHGLITDMLADTSLPPHVISGLKAVGSLLKPPENHMPINRPRVSPLVSLAESTNYGSDSEDLPYTGERPSSLPRRLRRSLPPSLLRRMSTSTWTTTTSATGMPTLEPEPCRTRSSSFRHSRESTPASSPSGSRSNSPSPNTASTISLTIPKSRSFSLASAGPVSSVNQKRFPRDRKNIFMPSAPEEAGSHSKPLSPLVKSSDETLTVRNTPTKEAHALLTKRLQRTSDYDSSDSPNNSDHSDNIVNTEETRDSKVSSNIVTTSQMEYIANRTAHHEVENLIQNNNDSQLDKQEDINTLPYELSVFENLDLLQISDINKWEYPIFDLSKAVGNYILSLVAYRLFSETGLFETFRIPLPQFMQYFHALEEGYRDKPYHNRIHATDVLHGVYYFTTQPVPGFQQINPDDVLNKQGSSSESDSDPGERPTLKHHQSFTAEDSYGIMGGNLPPLELMALYTAAAMHDYDHPGRTNAFLVTTNAPQAVLYNDRSVLENHHAAAAWSLFLSHPKYNFLCHIDKAEFKRFRFLVIEAILATDLKRHFEILAEFNAKVNEEDSPGVDWTSETDRLLVSQIVIKLADINGPCKPRDLHVSWTMSITEEFYEQGDEEKRLGLPISPYMDRRHPQLSKLQETFINHLVAPLCNAYGQAGLLPGTWLEEESDDEGSSESQDDEDEDDRDSSACKDTEDEGMEEEQASPPPKHKQKTRKILCQLTKNLKENHDMWVAKIKAEQEEKERLESEMENQKNLENNSSVPDNKPEMEPIQEEDSNGNKPPSPPQSGEK